MKDFVDTTGSVKGTALNRANLMAMQGFIGSTTTFQNKNGVLTVIETNSDGERLETRVFTNGTVIERLWNADDTRFLSKETTFTTKDGIINTLTEEIL